jgi:hypothetical protein
VSEREILELGPYVFAVLAWLAAIYFWFSARAARRGTNSLPFAAAELEAQKDFLRAEHAVQLRALEIERDQLRSHLRSRRAAADDPGDGTATLEDVSQLSYELEGARRQVETLKKELADVRANQAAQESRTTAKATEAARALQQAREDAEALHRAEERITLLTLELEAAREAARVSPALG